MTLNIIEKQALGLDQLQICELDHANRRIFLHEKAIEPFMQLREAAKEAGFDLQIVSAYRDFHRQLAIWNAKASGERAVLGNKGEALDIRQLDNQGLMKAIMRWSAVPGLSRHHWGTDMDIFDASAMCIEDVNLVPAEVEAGGPCAGMHEWLTERIKKGASFGFFRPYAVDKGAIAPEMWHLSFAPEASIYQKVLNEDIVIETWKNYPISLKEELLANITGFWEAYVDLDFTDLPAWISQ